MDYVNEAVDIERSLIFVAVPKTGTTSIRKQFQQQGNPLIPYPHLNILQIRDAIRIFFLIKNLGKNRSFPTDCLPTNDDIRVEANNFFKKAFKFASVRNPWERAVSLYFRKEGVRVSKKISFEEFVETHFYASDTCAIPTLHKNQYDWLSDENGDFMMDYVFKLENFESAIQEIKKRTDGKLKLEKLVENKNKESRSADYKELYNNKTKNIIYEQFHRDIDYFKFKF